MRKNSNPSKLGLKVHTAQFNLIILSFISFEGKKKAIYLDLFLGDSNFSYISFSLNNPQGQRNEKKHQRNEKTPKME